MIDINFIASYSASEDGIICSMAGYCWLLNPCPCVVMTGSAASSEVEVC